MKENGKIIFNGILLAGLLICTAIGHFYSSTTKNETPSMKVMDNHLKTTNRMKEQFDHTKFIEKVIGKLKQKGFQAGIIFSVDPKDKKEVKVVVRTETKDKETASQIIVQTIDEVAKENKFEGFSTTVNFPSD